MDTDRKRRHRIHGERRDGFRSESQETKIRGISGDSFRGKIRVPGNYLFGIMELRRSDARSSGRGHGKFPIEPERLRRETFPTLREPNGRPAA
jgi:hypothetical protein